MLLGAKKDIQKKTDRLGKIKRCSSLKPVVFPDPPMTGQNLPPGVSFRASLKKASLAVETALVLPIFFLGIVSMISFMDIYRIQTEHLTALCQRAKEAGMYAYAVEGTGINEITLPDVYAYTPVSGLISLPKIWMYNTVKVHAWTGSEYEAFQDTEEIEAMVYITESGTVFHRSLGCSYLNLSVTQVSGSAVKTMKNDYGEKYQACSVCSLGQEPAGLVYITEKGNCYHNQSTCSGLKRSVRMVKESEVAGRSPCSRCG